MEGSIQWRISENFQQFRYPQDDLSGGILKPISASKDIEENLWTIKELTACEKRQDHCERFLEIFTIIVVRGDVILTDEYATYRSSKSRNFHSSSKENPHLHDGLEHNPAHVMKWIGISGR